MSNQLDLPRAATVATRVGQATAVEQSRAIAEVQAQVIVAQRMPRDVDLAVTEMLRSCGRKALAEKAFYRFPRAGGQVSGESIVLAKELARCWGNLDYGIAELRRDDAAGESEMMAYAWDLQTNTRPRTTFIVPHVRDKTGGPVRLTEARDVYENNANMGARRVREMIFNILPPWFIEDAKAACYATLAADETDGKTIAERAATAVARFGAMGVRPEQLTQKVGAPQASWSATDLARLTVIFKSIERGESSKEEEFGIAAPVAPDLLAGADTAPAGRKPRGGKKPAASAAAVPEDDAPWPDGAAPGAPVTGQAAPPDDSGLPPLPGEDEAPDGAMNGNGGTDGDPNAPVAGPTDPGSINKGQLAKIAIMFGEAGFARTDREAIRNACAQIIGRPIESSTNLSLREASAVIDTLAGVARIASLRGDPQRAILDHLLSDVRAVALGEFQRMGITTGEGIVTYTGQLLDITPPPSLDGLAAPVAARLAVVLAQCADRDALDALLAGGTVPGGE